MGNKSSKPAQNTGSPASTPASAPARSGPAPAIANEGDLIKRTVLPFADGHPTEYRGLLELMQKTPTVKDIDLRPFKSVAQDALLVLPSIVRRAPGATSLDLDGIDMDSNNCLCLARALSGSAIATVSMQNCGITHERFSFFVSLLQQVKPRGGLDIDMTENVVWKEDGGEKFNEIMESQVGEMEKRGIRISLPALTLPPIDIEGQLVPRSELEEGKLYGNPPCVMVEQLHDVIQIKQGWEGKVEFLRKLCNDISALQKRVGRDRRSTDGCTILPRVYSFHAQRNQLLIIVESVTRNSAYKTLEKEFPPCAPRTGWPLHRRVRIAHQMALLTKFMHGHNTCIRGITPSTMYYTFGEDDISIVYTNLTVFREQNVHSMGHHAATYRFVDPNESGAVRAVTAPRDVSAIFRLLHYLLCYHEDPAQLKQKHVVYILPEEQDPVGFIAQHYRKQFVESLGDDFFKGDTLDRLSQLTAKCVQENEGQRPTIETVVTELQSIVTAAQ